MSFRDIAASHPRLLGEGFWVGVGQASTMVASLLAIKILTTLLSPLVYGEVLLLLGLVVLGTALFGGPILQANLRFYPDAVRDGRVYALRRLTLGLLAVGMACLVPLLLAGGAAWIHFSGSRIPFAAFFLVGAFLAADVLRSFEVGMQNAARRQKDYALRNAADAWAKPLLATTAILVLGPSAMNVLLGYTAGSAAVSLLLLKRRVLGEAPSLQPTHDPWYQTTRTAFLRYAIPLAPISILNWIMSLSDRYILAGVAGAGAAGVYGVAYMLGSQPFIAVNAVIHSTLRPVLYDAVAAGDVEKERRTLRTWLGLVLLVSVAGFLLLLILAPSIARLLLGPRFTGAAGLIPWIAGAYALQIVQQTFEVMMFAHGQTHRLVALQALAAASSLILYAILIPRFGAMGAAMGTLASFVLTSIASFLLAGAPRRLRWPIPLTPAEPPRPEITL